MSQEINLYQPALFENKVPFSSRFMARIVIAGLLILLTAGGINEWRVSALESRVENLQALETRALDRIGKYQRRYTPDPADPALSRQVERMREELQARRALLEMLSGEMPGKTQGFSSHIEGLAREDLSTVWLRRIHLDDDNLLLEGSTTRAADVPLYLQRLTRQQDFAGREFEHLQLTRSEKAAGVIDFLLQTTQEKKP